MRRMIRNVGLTALAVVALGGTVGRAEIAEEVHAYVGTKNCKKCHIKEWKSWSETAMAKAYDVLKPGERAEAKTAAGVDPAKDYTGDPECLICHTTGYGEPGGFTSIEETPELAGVGCEMCHGPGGTYTQDQYMSLKNKEYYKPDVVAVGLVDQVSAEQCTNCHQAGEPFPGAAYEFDFEAKKDEGTHEKFELKYDHSTKK